MSWNPSAGGGATLTAGKLAGRGGASGSGVYEGITLGTNLTLTGTTLDAAGGGGGGVPTSRLISTTAPLTGGGDLTADRTLAISAATTVSAGSMSAADKTKLDGVATGATANSSDATLLARANHTGTQAGSTVTGAYTAAGLTMTTASLLGRSTAATGAAEEITVGSGLSLSAGTLSATGGGSNPTVHMTADAAAIGPAITDYFASTLSLDANSTYEIECHAHFLKTTAGTVLFTWLFSNAPVMVTSRYEATPVTGFTGAAVTGAPVQAQATSKGTATNAHAASGSLTTAVDHSFIFWVRVRTGINITTLQLRATESAGTITPRAGSCMQAVKVA